MRRSAPIAIESTGAASQHSTMRYNDSMMETADGNGDVPLPGSIEPGQRLRPINRVGPIIKSTQRTLEILELFDLVRGELTAIEVGRRLGYPQSSAAALLHSLERMGYLDYSRETHGYLPSFRVLLLGSWLEGTPIREGRLRRMLEETANETGCTVMLAARFSIYSQYLHVVLGGGELGYYLAVGSRRLLVQSATGFALLRDASDDEIRRLVRRAAAEAEDGRQHSERDALANIQLLRDNGHLFVQGLVAPGYGAIAIRLPDNVDPRGRPLAVAVGGQSEDLVRRKEKIVETIHSLIQNHFPVSAEGQSLA
ncbi:helix-turn-helix domain-containing protein [Sphingomonas sp. C8-2]|nr:helix-turn-helix domain-containing protein [Sphingomonas sp. C8-2]